MSKNLNTNCIVMALTLVKGIQCPSLEQNFLFCDKIYLDAICDLFIQNKGGKKVF